MRVIANVRSDKKVMYPGQEEAHRMTIDMIEKDGEVELLGKFGYHVFFRFVTSKMDSAIRQLEHLMNQADRYSVGPGEILWEDLTVTIDLTSYET